MGGVIFFCCFLQDVIVNLKKCLYLSLTSAYLCSKCLSVFFKSLIMRRFLVLLTLSCLAVPLVYAQNKTETPSSFTFRNHVNDEEFKTVYQPEMGTHYLGQEVARELFIIDATYTYREEGTPTSPTPKIVVRKPRIYNATKKAVKYYEKMLKAGKIPAEEAVSKVNVILEKTYSMFYENSEAFEQYLKTQKKPEQIIAAFDLVELN